VEAQITDRSVYYTAPLCYGAACPLEQSASSSATSPATPASPGPQTATAPPPTDAVPATAAAAASSKASGPAARASSSSSSSSSSGSISDSEQAIGEPVISATPNGSSRGVRVFVAGLVGALCGARVVQIIGRARRAYLTMSAA